MRQLSTGTDLRAMSHPGPDARPQPATCPQPGHPVQVPDKLPSRSVTCDKTIDEGTVPGPGCPGRPTTLTQEMPQPAGGGAARRSGQASAHAPPPARTGGFPCYASVSSGQTVSSLNYNGKSELRCEASLAPFLRHRPGWNISFANIFKDLRMRSVPLHTKCESTNNLDGDRKYIKQDLTYVFNGTT